MQSHTRQDNMGQDDFIFELLNQIHFVVAKDENLLCISELLMNASQTLYP